MMGRALVIVCVSLIVAGAAYAAPADENAGKAVGGLKLVLKIDKDAYEEGEAWTGSVTAANGSDKTFAIDTMSGGGIKFIPVNGKEPKIVMHIGTGRGKDTGEKLTFPTIGPGKSATVVKFDPSPQPENVLATAVGGAMNAWDAAAGAYKMVFTYKMTEADAKALGMESPWTGEVESNIVTITVKPKAAKVTPVDGLALYLDIRIVGEKENRLVGGRARLVNTTDKPVVINARGATKIEFVDANGKVVPGAPLPIPFAEMAPPTLTLAPGDWVSIAKFSTSRGATMVQANPWVAMGLPVGNYAAKATYASEAAAGDAKEKPWAGTLLSNEAAIDIQTSNAPAAK